MESPLGFEMNCPRCGTRLEYVRKRGESHVLLCYDDGIVILPPNGRVFVAGGYDTTVDLPKLPKQPLGTR